MTSDQVYSGGWELLHGSTGLSDTDDFPPKYRGCWLTAPVQGKQHSAGAVLKRYPLCEP